MQAAVEMITTAQIKKVWFEAKQLGLLDEDIHKVINEQYGVTSIKELSKAQAIYFIDDLVRHSSKNNQRSGMASSRQLWKIEKISTDLEWTPERLRNFIKKYGHVENVKWLTERNASNIITALGKILKKQQENENRESEVK